MKKFTLSLVAILLSVWCFGQNKPAKTEVSSLSQSKTSFTNENQSLHQPQPKIFYSSEKSSAKADYMTQNFDGTWLSGSWTQTILLTAKTWQQNNPSATPFTTVDPSSLYSAICPYSLPTELQNEYLKTPNITGTSGAISLFLKFWAGYSYNWLPVGGQGNPGATLRCLISTNSGTSWTTLWDANNTPLFTAWGWHQILVDISAYKTAPFMLAWQVTGADGDLMALDNVAVYEPPSNDIGISAITSPMTTCNLLSSSEPIVVTISNYGYSPISNFNVSYKVNNNTPVTANYTGTINSGQTATYTFSGANAANLSVGGTYTIKAYSSLSGDVLASNDTSTSVIKVGAANVPFSMGFETTEDISGWTLNDANLDTYYWGLYSSGTYAHTGTQYISYPYNMSSAADDWFWTKCTNYIAGTNYVLKFWYAQELSSYVESLRVKIGSSNSIAAMTTQLVNLPSISNTSYIQSITNFTVPTSGVYYIGFQCYSAADQGDLNIDDISVDIYVDVNENSEAAKYNVFPNPANNLISVNAPEHIKQITIVNTLGAVVQNETVNSNSVALNTSSLQNGLYFIQIETANGIVTKKIQIIR